jgi:hypothetical protein
VENIFKEKSLRRKELARMPFKKKIEILIELQKMAKGVSKKRENKEQIVWQI